MSPCPGPVPPEFRQRAVQLARLREKPIARIAEDLGITESCLRNWQADIDDSWQRFFDCRTGRRDRTVRKASATGAHPISLGLRTSPRTAQAGGDDFFEHRQCSQAG